MTALYGRPRWWRRRRSDLVIGVVLTIGSIAFLVILVIVIALSWQALGETR